MEHPSRCAPTIHPISTFLIKPWCAAPSDYWDLPQHRPPGPAESARLPCRWCARDASMARHGPTSGGRWQTPCSSHSISPRIRDVAGRSWICGTQESRGTVSGETPSVVLAGIAMTRLASAIPVIARHTGREVVIVGGLAVMCRLSTPYRATTDLDTVDRRASAERSQLELLLSTGATPSGPSGALVHTPYGDVQVDVLEVTDAEINDLPDDPIDRLHVKSHAWAASTASNLVLEVPELAPLTVKVAESGPIIAMKLQSIMNRGAAKEGTDLLDIIRITLDHECGPVSRDQLAVADPQLRADALLHARRWFNQSADRSLAKVRRVPEGNDVEIEDVRLVGDLLIETLADR